MRTAPEKIGRYTILCELGVGGMSTVYLARSRGLGDFERLFALKMIHENLCDMPEFVSLFLNEARIAARIHHPNVVPVYDIDIEDGQYYLSMDYVSGETMNLALQATWNHGFAFPVDIAASVVASACEGLHAAHELTDDDGDPLGVVHRDVAPQNIILGYDGIVRVMDFGIAKALDQVSLTQPGTLRGSVPYMAPEQVNKLTIDRRSDVWALGVVLWETTVGKRLFSHHSPIGTVARILGMEVPKPSTLRKGYPPGLEAIVMKSLERDLDRRFQTAQEMGDALSQFLVQSGICVTSSVIKKFVDERFGERHQHRRSMERSASVVGKEVTSLPAVDNPDDTLESHAPGTEPIDDPIFARKIIEIVRPATVPSEDFETQRPTEVTELPKAKPRPSTVQVVRSNPKNPMIVGLGASLGFLLVIAVSAAIWPEPKDGDAHEEETAEIVEESEDPLATGSISVTDMAGDGGKAGTVAFYFRVIPAAAKIQVNGQPQESDLVVPQSRTRYTVRFEHSGYRPLVVSVSAEASRLIEANLEELPKVKKRGKSKRRR
jgi:serine/threonine protein kinase